MRKKTYRKPVRRPSHVGDIIKSGYLTPYNISTQQLAIQLDMPLFYVEGFIKGTMFLTPFAAHKISKILKMPSKQLLEIQNQYIEHKYINSEPLYYRLGLSGFKCLLIRARRLFRRNILFRLFPLFLLSFLCGCSCVLLFLL